VLNELLVNLAKLLTVPITVNDLPLRMTEWGEYPPSVMVPTAVGRGVQPVRLHRAPSRGGRQNGWSEKNIISEGSGTARHKKSRRKKSNADKDIKLRAKVYVKHTVTMYDQHDCCNILQKKVDANASLASAWRRH
jgi:hypothetical protein